MRIIGTSLKTDCRSFACMGYDGHPGTHIYETPEIEKGVAILEEFDIAVLSDITDDGENCEECSGTYEVRAEDDNWDRPCEAKPWHTPKPFHYLGWHSDPSAGIFGGSLNCAPAPFDSASEAVIWAGQHADEIRAEMDETPYQTAVTP